MDRRRCKMYQDAASGDGASAFNARPVNDAVLAGSLQRQTDVLPCVGEDKLARPQGKWTVGRQSFGRGVLFKEIRQSRLGEIKSHGSRGFWPPDLVPEVQINGCRVKRLLFRILAPLQVADLDGSSLDGLQDFDVAQNHAVTKSSSLTRM